MKKFATVLFAAAAVFSAPTIAQDGPVTLRIDSGSAMSSTGGEYVSATTGTQLSEGQTLMVNAGSSVTLMYGNDCSMTYNQPGVYTVPRECKKGGWANTGGSDTTSALIIIGAGLLGAAAINAMGDEPVGPLSTAVRHF